MAGCGLRVSEVAALKVEHLDGAGGYLHVVDGKGGKQRTSILPKPVLEALEALQGRAEGYVFEGREI
jgi:integrase/recombinase XerD